jgi:hypothetical protein
MGEIRIMARPEVDGDAAELERRAAEYCAAAQNSALPAVILSEAKDPCI